MYGLCVLSQVVQTGETSRAMTLEWAFTSVFSDLELLVFALRQKDYGLHGDQSYLMCLAKCSLLVKLKLHGG